VIAADSFLRPAQAAGFDFYTGVPCSFLTPIINRVVGAGGPDYVGAASEGEAVAIAAGAWLAGRGTVVMCQNSGLGNAVNPLTSLNHPFRIPTLLIVTWRGGPGIKDEPQHDVMGQITPQLLDLMEISHQDFPQDDDEIASTLAAAQARIAETDLPFALIMHKGSVRDDGLDMSEPVIRPRGTVANVLSGTPAPSRAAILERFLSLVPDTAAVVATTGKCGRELFTLDDREQHLYQVGSMGGASAMGLGTALNTKRKVVVLDGDGAALMKLGSLATIGRYAPDNLIHIVLDNGVHDSTGGQPTVSPNVDFAGIAVAAGYPSGYRTDDLSGFEQAFTAALNQPGPHFIHTKIAPGSMNNLGRPTIPPEQVARRFRDFVRSD
jgi:phosphonopyruvate decarboxylase